MNEDGLIVAIDGPAGAGKSTAARRLAERLGYVLIDTGALYRAVALVAKERGVSWDDAEALGALAEGLDLRFAPVEGSGRPPLFVDGEDRSEDIRRPDISQGASRVSAHGPVRDALLGVQRRMGARGGVVLEGRDIGTVVFPDADVKIFLTASDQVRAQRRYDELVSRGRPADLAQVRREIEERDRRDAGRAVAPLTRAPDAVLLDTSGLSLDGAVDRLVAIVAEARPGGD
ncbi:MAG TPA: (d)CMP kinase [Sandaracinaceae bacterium LLY-WYZ-13_1]|nr:(d)CMP kinase [Sandaracinaceae bacterium LLY-WYZ-13_1]